MLAKNPGATAVAVISLAIAIGPNCALFSVVDRLILKPPPVQGIGQIFDMNVRAQRPGVAIYTASLPSLISKQATLVSMDADGFTLNYSVANNWTGYLYSLALAGVRVRVGSFTKAVAAAPAVQAVTGLGFKPNLVVLSSVQDVARASGTITNPARRGLGASDGTTAGCSAYSDEDGRNTSSVHAIDKTNKLFMKMDNATQTIDAEADLASLDADGFTLRWTTNDAVATEVLYFALGAP